MKRSIALVLSVFMLAGAASPAAAQSPPPLRIAFNPSAPPLGAFDEAGRPTGFDVDIARELCRVLSRTCQLLPAGMTDFIAGLQNGRFDVVVASLLITGERRKHVAFTDRYWTSSSIFLGRTGGRSPPGAAEADGKMLGAVAGSAQAGYLSRHFNADRIRTFPAPEAAYQALVAGEVDLLLEPSVPALAFLKSPAGQGFDFVGQPLTVEGLGGAVGIAVRKGEKELLADLNRALRAILLDGTYDRLSARYFPFSIY